MDSVGKEHVKIDKISIIQFRRFENVQFEISKNITLIAGQNGISKSTLLGMLCQPFSFGVHQGRTAGSPDKSKYTENYHDMNLAEYCDLRGRPFFYDCEDVFRLSRLHDTLTKKYNYRLHLSGNCINRNSPIFNNGLLVRATKRKSPGKERIRFVAGPGVSQEAGEGNFPHPVIYLGLNRLWPLALLKKLDVKDTPDITDKDKKWYIEKYNEILVLDEHDSTTEFLKTGNVQRKDFIGTSSSYYNSESCSAGQDNLGQILTSILSFRHLKSKLNDKYQGGLLLIDEVDATFHAVAQKRIINTLIEVSEELNLQVIATTHSMHLLEYCSYLKNKIKILYLKKEGNKTIDSGFNTIEEIKDDLKVDATQVKSKKIKKVSVFFEDSVGKNMFFGIVGNKLNSYLNRVEMKSFDAGSLKNMACLAEKVPELRNVIFIPDGDIKKELERNDCKYHQNLLFLPGESRPETLIYKNLKDTDDSNPFWKKCRAKYKNYTHQFAITKNGTPPEPSTSQEAKKWYKNWYKNQSPYWGQMNKIVFNKWANDNKDECKEFCNKFLKILKKVSSEQIPKHIFKEILEKYEQEIK